MPTHLHTNTWRDTAGGEWNVLYCTLHSWSYNLMKLIYACMHVDKGSSIRYQLRVWVCVCVCVSTHSNREKEKRKAFQQLYDCIFWHVREEKRAAMNDWTGVCLSVRVGVVTLRTDLCVKEGEGEKMRGCWSWRRRWRDGVDGWDPTTDLSRRLRVGRLAAVGKEIRWGLPHLGLLLLHGLLKETWRRQQFSRQTNQG